MPKNTEPRGVTLTPEEFPVPGIKLRHEGNHILVLSYPEPHYHPSGGTRLDRVGDVPKCPLRRRPPTSGGGPPDTPTVPAAIGLRALAPGPSDLQGGPADTLGVPRRPPVSPVQGEEVVPRAGVRDLPPTVGRLAPGPLRFHCESRVSFNLNNREPILCPQKVSLRPRNFRKDGLAKFRSHPHPATNLTPW